MNGSRIAWALLLTAVAADPSHSQSQAKPLEFKNEKATIRVGQDGKIYASDGSVFIRCNPDGSDPVGAPPGGALINATATKEGIIAAAHAHFARNVTLLDPELNVVGRFSRFGDAGFRSPAGVVAGPSGDFYALDQGRDQILRFHPDGIRCGIYQIPREPAGPAGELARFRVCEKTRSIYVVDRAPLIRCFRFDDRSWKAACPKLWEVGIEGSLEAGSELFWGYGGFDVDENGVLYVLQKTGDVVKSYDPLGKPLKDVKPEWGELKPTPTVFVGDLQVSRGELFVHRHHPTELFQRFRLSSGERLAVAGAPVDCAAIQRTPKNPPEGRGIPARASDVGMPPGRAKPLRVLMVGNSQVNCVCDIPDILEDLSRSSGKAAPLLLIEEVEVGGVGLEGYWKDGVAQKRIAAGGWDWVVTNEIVYSYGGNTAKFQEYARKFDAEAKKAGARMLFFATGEVEASKAKADLMYRDAIAMARECGGRVAGAGAAWQKAWKLQPKLDFHHTDRAHPNAKGYYLNACVIYAALTGASPVGLDPFTLDKDEAAFLQKIAWEQAREDRAQESK